MQTVKALSVFLVVDCILAAKKHIAVATVTISAIRIFREILCVAARGCTKDVLSVMPVHKSRPSMHACTDLLGNILLTCCYPLTVAHRELAP